MTLLTQQQMETVAEAINQVEQQTDAELVAVLAGQSDDYRYIPLLWSAAIALVAPIPLLFTPYWLNTVEVLTGQWLCFFVLAFVLRLRPIAVHLIPKQVRYWRAANMARRQFLQNNLHHTRGETGVLIFVSEAERYVEIIADRGINQKVPPEQWQQLIEDFVARVKKGETLEGFLHCIQGCGEILKTQVPATEQKNELPNRLIVI